MTTFKRLFLLLPLLLVLIPSPASAATAGPGWTLNSVAAPTNFFSAPAETAACVHELETENAGNQPVCDAYEVSATNAGSEPTDGAPVTLSDTLPAGVTVADVLNGGEIAGVRLFLVENTTTHGALNGGETVGEPSTDCTAVPVQCTFSGPVAPDDALKMVVYVTVDEGTAEGASLLNRATVSGGGAPGVSTEHSNQVGSGPAPFGPSNFSFFKAGLNGSQELQAGGHPYELTTTIDLNSALGQTPEFGGKETKGGYPTSVEDVKDIVVDLPLGFAGSTRSAPQCTEAQLDSEQHCPPETVVGHLTTEPVTEASINSPIWNITPEYGHPAEFGYIDLLNSTHIAGYVSVVPTPAGYVLQFVAPGIPEVDLSKITVTFYGDPAKRDGTGAAQVPFFTNPTACSNGPQVAKLWVDSWRHPASFQPGGLIPTNLGEPQWVKATSESPPVTGCDALQFTPAIGSQPTTKAADSPSGLEFEQRLAQNEIFGTNATPALKDTTISFPPGMTVDPSAADGLGTCSDAQIGWQGHAPAGPGELYDFSQAPPECPESSKIGTVELETPLLPGTLHGEVFLAAQNENPFDSTFATYIVVNDPVTGVVLKLAGEVKANPATGQLTAVFDETPQLPFSVLKAHFFGGPRAQFATPPNCGTYTTNSILEPWSAPDSGLAPTPFDNYEITENCAIGFDPAFTGGSTNLQGGAYTPFVGSFERQDNDQELAGLTMNLPPGLVADVPSVTECGEAELKAEEADAPTGGCPASSKVGTVEAGAGPGPNPLFVPGNIFWTGPYNGGPFGLAVVVSANPGPFHFGNVVVRESIRINPNDAHVEVVSNPFPTFLDPVAPNGQTTGIPIKLRRVDFDIDRPGFTVNPTNCGKLALTGNVTSTQGASSPHSVAFQVTNCQTLKFAPKFAVSTSGKTSKARGASLTAKVIYPSGPQGTYANIAKVKVELPKALPSRLTTLQKACLAKTFEANPASCPAPSVIGHATATTPILPHLPAGTQSLEGPVYFVSHGGEAFPSLEMVLQGDGITIDLVGTTYISHAGITSTTFKTVPDAPVQSFEITLPEGKYSALAANGNLCAQKLMMPNEFVAHNGAAIHETTSIAVAGCKPAIVVERHKVRGKTATLTVSVPAAGRLVATGKGLSKGSGKTGKAGTVTVKLTLTNAETATLKKHPGRKLSAKVSLTFTPKHGSKLKTSTTVLVG